MRVKCLASDRWRFVFKRAHLAVCFASLFFCAAGDAAGADQSVYLTVSVSDEQGNPVSGARVNVHQSNLFAFRHGVVVPPDYPDVTDAAGICRLTVKVKSGEKLDLAIEVARENMEAQTHNLDLGTQFPTRLPLEKFTLKKKSEGGAGPVINVAIDVQSDEHDSIEGAKVVIWDTSLGTASGRFPGVTGGDGRATIAVLYGSADAEEKLPVEISKAGYKDRKIFINLSQKQIGKTVLGGTAVLEKAAKDATKVTVTVLDQTTKQGVGDATVVLDGAGYHSDTTNGVGTVTFLVSEIGTFAVRISQDNYKPFKGETRLLQGEQEKPLTFELEPKTKKDEGHDKIEVTVLAKDPTDEKSKPSPLAEAYVRAGTISATTESNGKAVLEGAFDEKQEVTVEAKGYKSQLRNVSVKKIFHYSSGSGSTTFILDPELSESMPLTLIVEVTASGKPVPGAMVTFSSINHEDLWSSSTNAAGEADFHNKDRADKSVSSLREGLTIHVAAKGYKEYDGTVSADLLKPSLEARRFSVQLDSSWDSLRAAIDALEPRVLAWNNDIAAKGQASTSADQLLAQLVQIKDSVSALREQLIAAQNTLAVNGMSVSVERCRTAARLRKEIETYAKDAEAKEKEVSDGLKEATDLAATCSSVVQGNRIKYVYDGAIRLTGEIGVLEKKAVKDANELKHLADEQKNYEQIRAAIEKPASEISEQLEKARAITSNANAASKRANDLNKTLGSRHDALWNELTTLKTTYGLDKSVADLPPDLAKRVQTMEQLLGQQNGNAFGLRDRTASIAEAIDQVERAQLDGEKSVAAFKRDVNGSCKIETMDGVAEEIGTRLTNSSFELGLAADLPARAQACLAAATKKTAASPATASDEVIVPDVTGFNDLGAAVTAAAPLIGQLIATKEQPPKGSTKLISHQDPPAHSKAKRGQPLLIYVYQTAAEAMATPSDSDEVRVPDLSVFDGLVEMKAAAAHVGLVPALAATTATPRPGQKFFAGQDPPAGKMAKRGDPLNILYSQKASDTTTTPSPAEPPASNIANGFEGKWGGTIQFGTKNPEYLQIEIKKQGDAYVVSSDKGKPVTLKMQNGMLVYDATLDFNGVTGIPGAVPDPNQPRLVLTASLPAPNEMKIIFKVISKEKTQEAPIGTLKRLP